MKFPHHIDASILSVLMGITVSYLIYFFNRLAKKMYSTTAFFKYNPIDIVMVVKNYNFKEAVEFLDTLRKI